MFDAGDKVVCVDDVGTGLLKEGEIYEVEGFESGHIFLKEIDYGWMTKRFKLVDGTSPFQRWEKNYV